MFSVNLDAVEVLGADGGEHPTEPPAEPTEAPEDPTEPPAEPTEVPEDPTEAPADPTPPPAPVPGTGAAALSSLGIAALISGCGAVLFRKQES